MAAVPTGYECPQCQESDPAKLDWEEEFVVRCLSCNATYDPAPSPTRWGSGAEKYGQGWKGQPPQVFRAGTL